MKGGLDIESNGQSIFSCDGCLGSEVAQLAMHVHVWGFARCLGLHNAEQMTVACLHGDHN